MCIYCGTTQYRKIYQEHFGPIPKDQLGRTYEIHHIDGNHSNNHPDNLQCVSIEEHYNIHLKQNDYFACWCIADRLTKTPAEISKERSELSIKINKQRIEAGTHNFLNSERQRKTAIALNKKRVEDGTHQWLGDRNPSHAKVADGTHHLLSGEIQRKSALDRLQRGTHNFQDSNQQRKKALAQLESGTHISQIVRTCEYCGKTGKGPSMVKWHSNNCRLSPTYQKQSLKLQSVIQCPHCGKQGKQSGMTRYHFENCRKRTY